MKTQRRKHSGGFKARVALEALRMQMTAPEIAGKFGVHPQQVATWKKQALDGMPEIFSERRGKAEKYEEELKARLYEEIGHLKVELDWLKKKSGLID